MRFFLIIMMAFVIQGCASLEGTMGLGAGAGAAAGLGTGFAVNYNTKGKIFTTAIGAVIGAGIGYLIHPKRANVDAGGTLTKARLEKYPFLSSPEVKKLCIDDKIEGNKFEEAHCIYYIDRQSVWLKPGENSDERNK